MRYRFIHIAICLLLLLFSIKANAQIDYEKEASRCFVGFQDIEYLDLRKAKMYADSAMIYALKSNNDTYIARAHQYLGWHYEDISAFKKARTEYYSSLEHYRRAGDAQGEADAYGNLGNAYGAMDYFKKSLEYQLKSLTGNEKILLVVKNEVERDRAQQGKTYALHNIAVIYMDIGLYEQALKYQFESLEDEVLSKNHKGEAISCNALAISYKNLNKIDSAIYFFERAISIYDALDNVSGLASTYFAYATMEGTDLTDFEKQRMITASLNMHQENEDMDSYVDQLLSIGSQRFIHITEDSIRSILDLVKAGIETHDLGHHRLNYFDLEARYFARIGDYQAAYNSRDEFLKLKAIDDEQKRSREIIVGSVKRDLEIKAYNDSMVQSEHYLMLSAVDQKKIADQRSWIVLGVLGGLILIISLLFVVSTNRKRKRLNELLSGRNEVIQEKNDIVEEHNRSMAASIQYAKRLQTAILPTREEMNQHLPDSFLFFRPKDVVSGDFYWFGLTDDMIYIAAADCTGHGVPGAMVSVVCSNALQRVLNEFQITSPSKILTKTRELVIATFARSDKKVEDGMDITLCAIHRRDKYVEFSGANNPLWIVRKNEVASAHDADRVLEGQEMSLLEFKSDKQPVGPYPDMVSFTQKRIPLVSGDQLYLFSDGFADQFGGAFGKKFKSTRLKQEILESAHQPMIKQGEVLSELFDAWKGGLEQVDDVCVIGLHIF